MIGLMQTTVKSKVWEHARSLDAELRELSRRVVILQLETHAFPDQRIVARHATGWVELKTRAFPGLGI
jgi:hypothetical protein